MKKGSIFPDARSRPDPEAAWENAGIDPGDGKKEAARVLDISRGTLYRKIVEYHLEPEPRKEVRR